MQVHTARTISEEVTQRQAFKMRTCAACDYAAACPPFAQDMRACGHALAEILAAGQWKSAAFIKYVKEAELEKEVAYQVAIESEEEEWID